MRDQYWNSGRYPHESLDRRNRALARFGEFEEVVLWFGRGAVCQLSLVQILDWLSSQNLGHTRITIVPQFAFVMPEEQARESFDRRQQVTAEQFDVARSAWAAYRSPHPLRLAQLVSTGLSGYPELRAALLCQLPEYPSMQNGLSWLEQRILEIIHASGEIGSTEIEGKLDQELRARGWGDIIVGDTLRRLILDWNQPVRFASPFSGEFSNYEFSGAILMVTDFGSKLLANDADYIAFNGTDRWIGGVHLEGHRVDWRWDDARQRLVEP